MKHLTTLIILIMLTGCAHHPLEGWDTKDKVLLGTFAALHTVDLFQTREIQRDNNGYYEMNPLYDGLTRDQTTAAMLAGYGLLYLAANYIPKYRTPILVGANIVSGVCVINNHSIGVSIKF